MKSQLIIPGLRGAPVLLLVAITLMLCAPAKGQTIYQSTVLADNPLAYYALNPGADGATNAPDLSGNGNDGQALNISIAAGPTAYITNAAYFDGSSDIDLSQGTNAGLLLFSGPLTLEAWVQPSSTTEFADIVAQGYVNASGYPEIELRVNGIYGANYDAGSENTNFSTYVSGGTQTTDWTYVVVSMDGTNCSLYENGVLVGQTPDTNGSTIFATPADWVFGNGSDAGNSRLFTGNISEVAMYNYGLSAAQVQTHYYVGLVGTSDLTNAVPIITNQPQPQAAYPGGTATFTVGVLSVLPTTNQWLSNDVALAGQTNATLTLNNVETNDAAEYSVVVGNNNGTTTSASALLAVLPPGVLRWSGTGNSGVWDTDTSANWIDLANGLPVVFLTGDQVLFDDTVGAPTSVTVSGTVEPGVMTVDSSTNAFSISSGTISGPGSFVKEGSSTLTITSAGSLTGSATISGGAVYAGNNCFSSVSSITITNSSTLDLAGGSFNGHKPITVSGTGLNGEGAIFNSYNDYPGESVNITLAGDTMFGGSARWDLAAGSEISGPYNLTLDWSAGAGYSQWNSLTVGADIADVLVTNSSTLGFSGMDTSCQNPDTMFTIGRSCQLIFYSGGFNGSFSATNGAIVTDYNGGVAFNGNTIHLYSGSTLYLYGAGISIGGSSLIFEDNELLASYYNSGANNIGSAVTLNGVVHFVLGDHSMNYTNVVSGPGGFVLDYYNNDVVLSATNTYSGPTIIGSSGNSPEVALTGDGSISDSSLIFFGGTNADVVHLDVSGRSDQTLTLASGQTLAGIGTVNGSLVVSPGATISPAGTNTTIGITTGSNPVGTLAALNGVVLNGTTLIKLDGDGTNDVVEAQNGIAYGGTLNLVNISGTPLAAGNSFLIFNALTNGGSFATITPSAPGTGLVWDTSQLSSGIIGVLSAPPPQLQFTNGSISAGSFVFGGSGGTPNGPYTLLTTTNLSSPWVPIATNSFDANGDFSVTNAIADPQQFFSIEQ